MLVPSYENKQISPGSIKHNKSLVWRHTTVSIKLEKADPYRRFNRRQEPVSMPKDSLKYENQTIFQSEIYVKTSFSFLKI